MIFCLFGSVKTLMHVIPRWKERVCFEFRDRHVERHLSVGYSNTSDYSIWVPQVMVIFILFLQPFNSLLGSLNILWTNMKIVRVAGVATLIWQWGYVIYIDRSELVYFTMHP